MSTFTFKDLQKSNIHSNYFDPNKPAYFNRFYTYETLQYILNKIQNGGNCIFTHCYAANDEGELGAEIRKLNPKINYYLNGDFSVGAWYRFYKYIKSDYHHLDLPLTRVGSYRYGYYWYAPGVEKRKQLRMTLTLNAAQKDALGNFIPFSQTRPARFHHNRQTGKVRIWIVEKATILKE